MDIKIGNDWDDILAPEFSKPYFAALKNNVENAYATMPCFPPVDNIFNTFKCVPYKNVKVVVLGQDPYPGTDKASGKQFANGMAFAVNNGIKIAKSLNNIFKEVDSDLGCTIDRRKTDLLGWASQGVLLLNTALTVQGGNAGSHAKLGWHTFTDSVIKLLNNKSQPLVFMLWGNHAIQKNKLITVAPSRFVLTSSHPCPLSARISFFGSKQFSQCNKFLLKNNIAPIDFCNV